MREGYSVSNMVCGCSDNSGRLLKGSAGGASTRGDERTLLGHLRKWVGERLLSNLPINTPGAAGAMQPIDSAHRPEGVRRVTCTQPRAEWGCLPAGAPCTLPAWSGVRVAERSICRRHLNCRAYHAGGTRGAPALVPADVVTTIYVMTPHDHPELQAHRGSISQSRLDVAQAPLLERRRAIGSRLCPVSATIVPRSTRYCRGHMQPEPTRPCTPLFTSRSQVFLL